MKKVKQKLLGIMIIVLSIVSCIITRDGTASVILIPIGIYTLLAKEDVMTDSTKNNSFEDIKQ